MQAISWRRIGRRLAAAFPCVALVCAAPVAAQPVSAVAMIADCAGRVIVEAAGGNGPCAILTYLGVGARIEASEGGTVALVYFASGREFTFDGPAEIVLGTVAPRAARATPRERDLALAAETDLVAARGDGYARAAIVMRGGPRDRIEIRSPRDAVVLDARPEFRWEALRPGVEYRLTVVDESGRVAHEATLEVTRHRLPADVALVPDRYYTWRVEASGAGARPVEGSAQFVIATNALRARVERLRPRAGASVSERVLFATWLESQDMRVEAREVWAALAAERPDDPALRERARE